MSDTHPVQFDCPVNLLEEFDKAIKEFGFTKRSEALRHLMREFNARHKRTKES